MINRKKLVQLTLSILLIASSNMALADNSRTLLMDRYQFNANSNSISVLKRSGWGLQSCPKAQYINFYGTQKGYDLAVSTIMLAYANKAKMRLHATCSAPNANGDIVSAVGSIILLEDLE